MHPFRFLTLCGLFYFTLVAVFGGKASSDTTTTRTAPPVIVTAPLAAPDLTPATMTTEATNPAFSSTSVVPLVGPDTPCQELIPIAVRVGWPADREILETLASLAYRESRCQNIIPGDARYNGSDHGPMQINNIWLDEATQILGDPALLDTVEGNLKVALEIYRWHEANVGCGWKPWSLQCS